MAMGYDLEKKIDDYSAELFTDLGLASLSEEGKADLYARLEEHLHRAILSVVRPLVEAAEIIKINQALDHEDYYAVGEVLRSYPQYKNNLESKIDEEFNKLRLIIVEEQKNARTGTDPTTEGN